MRRRRPTASRPTSHTRSLMFWRTRAAATRHGYRAAAGGGPGRGWDPPLTNPHGGRVESGGGDAGLVQVDTDRVET